MEIVKDWPPNIAEIRQRFDLTGKKPVFTYGDKLYNPYGYEITGDLMVHEQTHLQQQKDFIYQTGYINGTDGWWGKYLQNDAFRLSQELEAYRKQYKYACEHYSRQFRRQLLGFIASSLSSKMYGSIIDYEKAKLLISQI